MNKNELAAALTKLRIARLAESRGHSSEEARAIADDAIRQQGGLSGIKAMATPEGSIVTIVESHLQYIAKRCAELGDQHIEKANEEALAAIEAHRSRFGNNGLANYPKNIDDYVYYRINLEVQKQLGCTPESMGLDRQTTKVLTHTAKANLIQMLRGDSQQQSGAKSCFIATACFGSSDAATVITLRRYREAVLRKTTIGRSAVYWYYKLSPPIARYIDNHEKIRKTTRNVLAKIANYLAKRHGL